MQPTGPVLGGSSAGDPRRPARTKRWLTPIEGALVVALVVTLMLAIGFLDGLRGTESGGVIRAPAAYAPTGLRGPLSLNSRAGYAPTGLRGPLSFDSRK